MLYDKNPAYPHFSHLPFAKEPLKAIYVVQRIITTLFLVPIWLLANLPRSRRPRKSWSLRQLIFVNFTRRIYRVTEVAGVTWGTRNPEQAPRPNELKETEFEWAPPLKDVFRSGIVVDRFGRVPFKKVGCFVWREKAKAANDEPIPVVSIFCHGGGYSQLSAHEKSRTSHIPRRLMKDKLFSEIYTVEYRLLQHAPLPAVIMDAAAVYAHVVSKYYGSDYVKSQGSPPKKPCKIILSGDSSGGNLALALARWVRDEGQLPMPDGLLLFSPSCDISHAFPSTQSSYIPRPNEDTDYLTDTPEPRALMQRTFLGFKYRPGGTGWGQWEQGRQRDGGDQFERHFFTNRSRGNGRALASAMASAASASTAKLARNLMDVMHVRGDTTPDSSDIESQPRPQQQQNRPPPPSLATDFIAEEQDLSKSDAILREFPGHESPEEKKLREQTEIEEEARSLMEIIHSEYVSPASPRVLRRWGHAVDLYDGGRISDRRSPEDDSDKTTSNAGPTRPGAISSSQRAKTRVWLTPTIACNSYEWESDSRRGGALPPSTDDSEPSEPSSSNTPIPEVKQIEYASPSPENTNTRKPRPGLPNQDAYAPQNSATKSYRSRYPQFQTLFAEFPKTMILIGDAERLTTEVGNLARAMGSDVEVEEELKIGGGDASASSNIDERQRLGDSSEGDIQRTGLVSLGNGRVQVRWIPDAVHDVFIIPPGWWDEKTKDEVWKDVKDWTNGFHY
ncbi:hypothetical protein D9757_008202 [Collybiopsis confluens]|uniref:Alpha/beta hydrolase fold-3 domain-containing protein n=1 Tax=Collybiopsis confluens TaxID=2823264 RepID=A0A8H5HBL0_9AGAR|nr:hypothetical protein D9757_008202 [Collybiopsis confluens]